MHQSYVITGVTDEETIRKQAHKRAADKRYPETTHIHKHKYTDPCNSECYMISPTDGDAG